MPSPGDERRRPSRFTDEDLRYLRLFIERERALEEVRKERGHYKRVFVESLIKWAIPVALTAAVSFLLWTGKLWILAALEAIKDVQR